jgi:hypothetical protein
VTASAHRASIAGLIPGWPARAGRADLRGHTRSSRSWSGLRRPAGAGCVRRPSSLIAAKHADDHGPARRRGPAAGEREPASARAPSTTTPLMDAP